MTTNKAILAERSGPVLHLTLNRPEQKNAMSLDMVTELSNALDSAEEGGEVRVIVLRGAGGTFCSGGDIAEMTAALGAEVDEVDPIEVLSREFGQLTSAFAETGLAVVVVVEGAAMGGGFGLACVADVTIAAPSARFGLPETSIGLIPAQIAPFLIDRLGYAKAKHIAVLGDTLDAEEAEAIGLVDLVAKDVDAALADVLARILRRAPGALGQTKKLMQEMRHATPSSMIDRAARVFAKAVRSEEGEEGTRAFLEKRKPSWAPAKPAG